MTFSPYSTHHSMGVSSSSVTPDTVNVALSGVEPDGVWPGSLPTCSRFASNSTGFARWEIPCLHSKTCPSSIYDNKDGVDSVGFC